MLSDEVEVMVDSVESYIPASGRQDTSEVWITLNSTDESIEAKVTIRLETALRAYELPWQVNDLWSVNTKTGTIKRR